MHGYAWVCMGMHMGMRVGMCLYAYGYAYGYAWVCMGTHGHGCGCACLLHAATDAHPLETLWSHHAVGVGAHTYIHTYIRTYVRTYIHTYIHTYHAVGIGAPLSRNGNRVRRGRTLGARAAVGAHCLDLGRQAPLVASRAWRAVIVPEEGPARRREAESVKQLVDRRRVLLLPIGRRHAERARAKVGEAHNGSIVLIHDAGGGVGERATSARARLDARHVDDEVRVRRPRARCCRCARRRVARRAHLEGIEERGIDGLVGAVGADAARRRRRLGLTRPAAVAEDPVVGAGAIRVHRRGDWDDGERRREPRDGRGDERVHQPRLHRRVAYASQRHRAHLDADRRGRLPGKAGPPPMHLGTAIRLR